MHSVSFLWVMTSPLISGCCWSPWATWFCWYTWSARNAWRKRGSWRPWSKGWQGLNLFSINYVIWQTSNPFLEKRFNRNTYDTLQWSSRVAPLFVIFSLEIPLIWCHCFLFDRVSLALQVSMVLQGKMVQGWVLKQGRNKIYVVWNSPSPQLIFSKNSSW